MAVTDGSVRIQARGERSGLIVVLSAVAGFVIMVGAVIATLAVLDEFRLITDGNSMRGAVTVGTLALVGTFLGARPLVRRLLPLEVVETEIPFRYIVSAEARDGVLWMLCTAPSCAGRIAFRTADAGGLVRGIETARHAAAHVPPPFPA